MDRQTSVTVSHEDLRVVKTAIPTAPEVFASCQRPSPTSWPSTTSRRRCRRRRRRRRRRARRSGPGATRRTGSANTTTSASTRHRRGAPCALTCASRAPWRGSPTHVRSVTPTRSTRSSARGPPSRWPGNVDRHHVAGVGAARQPETMALAEGDELDRGPRRRPRRSASTTRPGRAARRSPRKAARPPVAVMKHTSWLSGLSAVAQPEPRRLGPHLGLREVPDREAHPSAAPPRSSTWTT